MKTMSLRRLMRKYANGDETGWKAEFAYLEKNDSEYLSYLADCIMLDGGIIVPIHLGWDKRVWDGHHRIYVAKSLGMKRVPVYKQRKV